MSDIFLRDRTLGTNQRVSVDSKGNQADDSSSGAKISRDGRYVVFQSLATNLVSFDTNESIDIFIHDLVTGETSRVSVDSDEGEANGASLNPTVSRDGRFVCFYSIASNLVDDDTNGESDLFVRDRDLGITHRVTLGDSESQANDRCLGFGMISGDGRRICFSSHATNMVGQDTNATVDVFVRSRSQAQWTEYGQGFPGTHGIPSLSLSEAPVLGLPTRLQIGNSRGQTTLSVLFTGLESVQWPTAWGGVLEVNPLFVTALSLPAAGGNFPFTLPSYESLEGLSLFLQALQVDPGAHHSVSFTPGVHAVLGW